MRTEEALCKFLIQHGRMRVVAGRGFALVEAGGRKQIILTGEEMIP